MKLKSVEFQSAITLYGTPLIGRLTLSIREGVTALDYTDLGVVVTVGKQKGIVPLSNVKSAIIDISKESK